MEYTLLRELIYGLIAVICIRTLLKVKTRDYTLHINVCEWYFKLLKRFFGIKNSL
jgi:hypothetical protein